jgi:hypothetical protein
MEADTLDKDAAAKGIAVEKAMEADGVAAFDNVQADYFGFEETHTVYLPDGKSWISHQTLNEGQRRKYLNAVNRDVRVSKATGDAILSMKSGEENHALLVAAITGWNLTRGGQPVPFSSGSPGANLEQFLDKADPRIIDLILKDIRRKNSWLLAEMTVEEIDKEIEALNEMRETKVKEEAGNAS